MHHKWQSYDVSGLMYGSWDMKCDIIFCHSELFFALLPPMDPENKNFEKMKKKTLEDIITLQMCTINDSHMMHGSWDI